MPYEIFAIPALLCLIYGIIKGLKMNNKEPLSKL
ncbi:hypothetical protein Phep_1960 [Pedobacter heparinus DSM 2366]|uniref:Uncharacterized protein n=1 Tax=Pedobacter heparinus (strain ATCC 13125 / DSM 2366 / CIP 104194 / JCM 7457 / NBRC 12017 / NCIMB 9290 / NRRL B-14731 / HIM 762-3) TaxID=485917 RepID=C6XW89_PEDHD|nr:hypothetical protein Phep_1960 [Pedobacter heparinus DSM 2366]